MKCITSVRIYLDVDKTLKMLQYHGIDCHRIHNICLLSETNAVFDVMHVRPIFACVGFVELTDKLQVFSCDNRAVRQLQFGIDGSIVKLVTNSVCCCHCC